MYSLIASILCSVVALGSSCNKSLEPSQPVDPPVPTERYNTDLPMVSATLGTTLLYSVYLPKEYSTATDKRYPVVYLLHGIGDDHKSWNDQYLNVSSLVNTMELNYGLEPMIYVMPQGFRSYYVNTFDGSYKYMDMFAAELVPFIDQAYRTVANREHRAAIGYSMGGFGAMILPTKHKELFSVSVPLSMSFRTDQQYKTESQSGWNDQWGRIFGGAGQSGDARLTPYYKEHSPFYMFTSATAGSYSWVKYYLDCGDDEEQLLVANDDLHVQMRDVNMPHEFRVRNGGHESAYWRSGTMSALGFVSAQFNNRTYPDQEVADLPSSYSAVRENRVLEATPCEVFLPKDYYQNPAKEYQILYYLHNGDGLLSSENVMKMLNSVQVSKPFVMICADGSAMSIADFKSFVSAAENNYRIARTSDSRVALGYDAGGKTLYEASLEIPTLFSSLFLLDAAIDEYIAKPNNSTYYFFTLADMGKHYKGANALYKYCRAERTKFEYRVYNGLPTSESALYGVQQMRSYISEKIKP